MGSLIEIPAEGDCLLYLLRHGATPPNLVDPPVMQGDGVDEPLAPIGREQAARVATLLGERPIRAVYSSPMLRAMETASLVAERHGLPVEPVEGLREVKVGVWEGSNWPDVERRYPNEYRAFRADPGRNGYPGGENLRQLLDRVTASLEALMERHVGAEVVVSAHSVVNRVYVGSLLGIALADGYFLPQANCCVNVVRWRAGEARLLAFNSLNHLL